MTSLSLSIAMITMVLLSAFVSDLHLHVGSRVKVTTDNCSLSELSICISFCILTVCHTSYCEERPN